MAEARGANVDALMAELEALIAAQTPARNLLNPESSLIRKGGDNLPSMISGNTPAGDRAAVMSGSPAVGSLLSTVNRATEAAGPVVNMLSGVTAAQEGGRGIAEGLQKGSVTDTGIGVATTGAAAMPFGRLGLRVGMNAAKAALPMVGAGPAIDTGALPGVVSAANAADEEYVSDRTRQLLEREKELTQRIDAIRANPAIRGLTERQEAARQALQAAEQKMQYEEFEAPVPRRGPAWRAAKAAADQARQTLDAIQTELTQMGASDLAGLQESLASNAAALQSASQADYDEGMRRQGEQAKAPFAETHGPYARAFQAFPLLAAMFVGGRIAGAHVREGKKLVGEITAKLKASDEAWQANNVARAKELFDDASELKDRLTKLAPKSPSLSQYGAAAGTSVLGSNVPQIIDLNAPSGSRAKTEALKNLDPRTEQGQLHYLSKVLGPSLAGPASLGAGAAARSALATPAQPPAMRGMENRMKGNPGTIADREVKLTDASDRIAQAREASASLRADAAHSSEVQRRAREVELADLPRPRPEPTGPISRWMRERRDERLRPKKQIPDDGKTIEGEVIHVDDLIPSTKASPVAASPSPTRSSSSGVDKIRANRAINKTTSQMDANRFLVEINIDKDIGKGATKILKDVAESHDAFRRIEGSNQAARRARARHLRNFTGTPEYQAVASELAKKYPHLGQGQIKSAILKALQK